MNKKALMRHAKRGFEILRRQGPKAFWNKVKIKLSENQMVYVAPQDEKIIGYDEMSILSEEKLGSLQDAAGKPHLAVQLHLYYEDLLPEFVENLGNIPCPFDLFVSIRDKDKDEREQSIRSIKEACKSIPTLRKVEVRATKNRGRDIAPMYVLFGQELRSYKYVLHMHSKKDRKSVV